MKENIAATPKIVCVGFQKTGTTSLGTALKRMGYSVCGTRTDLTLPILHGNVTRIRTVIAGYDAVKDTPWPLLYKDIDRWFPGSKFVLTYRNPESWYNSVRDHIGTLRSPLHEWIYGWGKGIPAYNRDNTLRVYEDHIDDVYHYFRNRPDDLLTIDFSAGEGWDSLCDFVGRDRIEESFPHEGKRKKAHSPDACLRARVRMLRKRCKYFFLFRYIYLLGLHKKPRYNGYMPKR